MARPKQPFSPPRLALEVRRTPAATQDRAAYMARVEEARQFEADVGAGRANYASLLSRVWQEASKTLAQLETDRSLTLKDKIAALTHLGKLMPMLAKAEEAHVARIAGIRVEDMTEAQLVATVRQMDEGG